MKKLFILFTLAALLYSNAAFGNSNYYYVGADLLYSDTEFKNGYGKDVFSTAEVSQYNVFVGHYFSRLFGIEAGYAKSVTNNNQSVVAADSDEFGVPNFTAMVSNVYDATRSAHAYNINYTPQFQITQSVSLVAVFGMSYIKTSDTLNLILFDDAAATPAQQNDYNINFTINKFVPRCGARLQYLVTRMLGIRLTYMWENTALLTPTTTRNINPNQILQAKFTNTSTVGIGAFFKF